MDYNELLDQIVARVAAKLIENGETVTFDAASSAASAAAKKPGLMVLTQEHGDKCHDILESVKLKSKFDTCCALLENYECAFDAVDVVVLFDLTVDAIAKLSAGIADTPYLKCAQKALLAGKKLYVPTEQVELYKCKQTAPECYYAKMEKKLLFLVEAGLCICPQADIEDKIISDLQGGASASKECACANAAADGAAAAACVPASAQAAPASVQSASGAVSETAQDCGCCNEEPPAKPEKEVTFSKRVVTERDIIDADKDGVTAIHITEKNILTALAKDAAMSRDIRIIRD